ncbi:MAG: vWA domain-containing protein [Mycobacteriales bacterium]
MPYSAEISRAHPTCFVFVVDQSGSMNDQIGGEGAQRKAQVVSDAINRLLYELTLKCAKEEGVRDYFHVAVIGYGTSVGSAFAGVLAGRDLVPLSVIATSPARLEERTKKTPDGAGGLIDQTVKFPVWLDPVANGGTPMSAALGKAAQLVSGWLDERPSCFPPVVLHLTDGESSDGDPSEAAQSIRSLLSADGNALLFNLHVSGAGGMPATFPDSDSGLPDQFSRLLFSMSSSLPEHMKAYAQQQGFTASEGTRGFVYNADVSSIVQFLDIGTRASDLR